MGRNVVKIYGDGEIWLDGRQNGKIYPDGDIWIDGRSIGRIYEDGDIWIEGRKAGRVFANGDVWIGSKKVATGIYLLELLGDSDPPPPREAVPERTSGRSSFGSTVSQAASAAGNTATSGVGCMVFFVVVLIIVAFIYGAFRFWLAELPDLLFGNMHSMGSVATASTYICMVLAALLHCSMATKSKHIQFLKALLMQGAAFFANIIVFISLDILLLAASYGFPLSDALPEIRRALSGSVSGMVLIALFVGLAPTIASSTISALLIKSGKVISLPSIKKTLHTSPTRKKSAPCKGSKKLYWDGERIAKAVVGLCMIGILAFFLSTLPMSLFMGPEEVPFEAQRLLLVGVAVFAGIFLRRILWREGHRSFLLGWLVQSAMQIAACFACWAMDGGISSIFVMSDIAASCCGLCLFFGLLISLFSLAFVKD